MSFKYSEIQGNSAVVLYTLRVSIYPSSHKQLRRHIPNPFREFPLYLLIVHYTIIKYIDT